MALALVLPSLQVVSAQTQVPIPKVKPATPAQQQAIEQWAVVIRRGKTAKVMSQVAALINQVEHRVEAQHDRANNIVLRASLLYMREAATFKAQGMKKRNKKLIRAAESSMRTALQLIHMKVIYTCPQTH
jgi:hypothetical protein